MKKKEPSKSLPLLTVSAYCEHLRGSSVLIHAGRTHGVTINARVRWDDEWGIIRLVEKPGSIARFWKMGKNDAYGIVYIMRCLQCGVSNPTSIRGKCSGCKWVPGSRIYQKIKD